MNTEKKKTNNTIENKPKKIGCKEKYQSRVVCEICNKSNSLKCMRYAHSCTRPDIPPREYNNDDFKSYYTEKYQCNLSCFICNVKYHCYTSLTKHLNKNKDCKLKRLKDCVTDVSKELENLKIFKVSDVKEINNCLSEEYKNKLLKPFYQQGPNDIKVNTLATLKELLAIVNPPRIYVLTNHDNKDIGFKNM